MKLFLAKCKSNTVFLITFAALPLMLMTGCSTKRSLLLVQPVQAQTQKPASSTTQNPQRIYLAERRVSFVPPSGFTAMTPEEIALKFPNRGGNLPQHVYANQRRSISVAITFSQAQISQEQLPELKDFMPKFLTQVMPNIKWIKQDFAVINKVRWVKLEFISQAIDTKIHNDTYFTSFNSKLLGFNFNSTVEQYDLIKAELDKSRDSIAIN